MDSKTRKILVNQAKIIVNSNPTQYALIKNYVKIINLLIRVIIIIYAWILILVTQVIEIWAPIKQLMENIRLVLGLKESIHAVLILSLTILLILFCIILYYAQKRLQKTYGNSILQNERPNIQVPNSTELLANLNQLLKDENKFMGTLLKFFNALLATFVVSRIIKYINSTLSITIVIFMITAIVVWFDKNIFYNLMSLTKVNQKVKETIKLTFDSKAFTPNYYIIKLAINQLEKLNK